MACALLSLFAAVVVVDANRYWARMMALAFGVTNAAGVIALFRELRWGRHAAFVGLVAPGTGFVALLVGFGKGVADVGDSDPTIPFWGAWALFVAGLAWYLYGTKGVRDYYASLRTAASD